MDLDTALTAFNRRLAALEEAAGKATAMPDKGEPSAEQIKQAIVGLDQKLAHLTGHVGDIQKRLRDGEALDEINRAIGMDGPIMQALNAVAARQADLAAEFDTIGTRLTSLEQKSDLLRSDLDRGVHYQGQRDHGLEGSPIQELQGSPAAADPVSAAQAPAPRAVPRAAPAQSLRQPKPGEG